MLLKRKSTNKGFRRKSLYHLKTPANCQIKMRFRKESPSSKIEEDISAKFYWIFKYFLKWHKDLSKICIARQKENFCSRITINPFKKSPTAPTFSTLSSVVSAISKKSLNELHSINFYSHDIGSRGNDVRQDALSVRKEKLRAGSASSKPKNVTVMALEPSEC